MHIPLDSIQHKPWTKLTKHNAKNQNNVQDRERERENERNKAPSIFFFSSLEGRFPSG